jgi:hypothetical protein
MTHLLKKTSLYLPGGVARLGHFVRTKNGGNRVFGAKATIIFFIVSTMGSKTLAFRRHL